MPVTLFRAITLALLAVAAIGLLIDAALTTISAAPVQPYVLFGLAKTGSGTPVPSGALIEARIGNVNYAQTVNQFAEGSQDTRTHSLNSGFNYGSTTTFQVCADDPATGAVEGGAISDQVVFFVAGIQAEARRIGVDGSPQTSIPFKTGVSQQVKLTIPSLTAPTAIPGSASVFACTVGGAQIPPAPTGEPTPISGAIGDAGTASPTPAATSTPTATVPATSTPTSIPVPSVTPTPTAPVFLPPPPTATAAPTPEPIPVVSAWGLVILGAMLTTLMALAVGRRPSAT